MLLSVFKGMIGLLGLVGGIYMLLINPILFRFWIIPKITDRFNVIFDLNYPTFTTPGARWIVPQLEISYYICCVYMQWEWPIKRYHLGKMMFFKDIEYDIKKASRAEIIMSFITLINIFIIFVFCGLIITVLDYFSLYS